MKKWKSEIKKIKKKKKKKKINAIWVKKKS